ncbi:hypothetical protein [Micromonospora sp. NPDC005299]|uniref:hypothetical protein n=1 Tax=Micromonospora sp. NPDC005299 TaxID=3364231 RepID=UPI00368AF1BB
MQWLVGQDPWSERLAVVPLAQAVQDVEAIGTIGAAQTLGEIRQSAPALAIVREWYDPDRWDEHAELDSLPDDTPFDVEDWLGECTWQPVVRLRTAELAPQDLLEEYGRLDDGFGIDYEPAPWLSVEDQPAIEARLRKMDYEIVHDDALLTAYLG